MVIDSHQHFWEYDPLEETWITEDMRVLKRDFMPDDLGAILLSMNIDGCVAVQAGQSEAETEFLLSLADKYDFIKGVVGWVDLRSPALEERLMLFSRHKKICGFRHIVQSETNGFMASKSFVEGVKKLAKYNFTYDLLIYHHQLDEALVFLEKVQDVKIVIDHLAKPSIRTNEITDWQKGMGAAARFENVWCKISGMVTEADWKKWKYEDLTPYLDTVFEAFGTERLMYGSDWPVCLLAASYEEQFSNVLTYLDRFSEDDRNSILGDNAGHFYGF